MPESPPPTTLAWLRHAASCGRADARLTLHILERLEALEARDKEDANCWASVRQSMHRLRERIEALERRPIPGTVELAAPAPEAAPVATDNGLLRCYGQAIGDAVKRGASHNEAKEAGLRAIYDLGRQHGAAQPARRSSPAGGLVERVGEVMERHRVIGDIEGSWDAQARAAIREVAAWLRENEFGYHAALSLEQEAGR